MKKLNLSKYKCYWATLRPNEFVPNKSFYGKARTLSVNGVGMFLISYDTIVCYIDDKGLHRTWDKWSATTARHITAFLTTYQPSKFKTGLSKKEWLALPVEECPVDGYDIPYGNYKTNEHYC